MAMFGGQPLSARIKIGPLEFRVGDGQVDSEPSWADMSTVELEGTEQLIAKHLEQVRAELRRRRPK